MEKEEQLNLSYWKILTVVIDLFPVHDVGVVTNARTTLVSFFRIFFH